MPEETIAYHDPSALVQTDWVEAHRGDTKLRIFDCTTHLQPAEPGTDVPYRIVSGKADYDAGHIPGAGFLDIQGGLSDNSTKLRFTLPSPGDFAAGMCRHGVGDGVRVVLYSTGNIMWATRVWWMLRAFGFDNAAVLDGGWGGNGGRRAARFRPSHARIPRRNSSHGPVPGCSSAKSGCGRRSEMRALSSSTRCRPICMAAGAPAAMVVRGGFRAV